MQGHAFSSVSITLEQVVKHFEQVKISTDNCIWSESSIVLEEADNAEFIVRNEQRMLIKALLSIFQF